MRLSSFRLAVLALLLLVPIVRTLSSAVSGHVRPHHRTGARVVCRRLAASDACFRATSPSPAVVLSDRGRVSMGQGRVLGAPASEALTAADALWPHGQADPPAFAEEAVPNGNGPQAAASIDRPDGPPATRGGAGPVDLSADGSSADDLSRLVDDFLGTVAHELRTPIGLIKEYAATLLAPDAPRDAETVRHCLFVVVEVSTELEELVDRILAPSRMKDGALGVAPRPVRLRPLVRTAIEWARIRTAGHGLRLDVPADLPRVLADPIPLRQVLGNLLDNAIKYSPDGGPISVSAEAAGGEVVVRVSDQGLGVPAEELGVLFERFYRGAAARARQIQGEGLGLAICKGIIAAHGGRIWAESPAPGRPAAAGPGTTILFTLPIAPGATDLA